ncbi:MAG: hypothetical protein ABF306_03860 [Nocardioides marinisabuli]|uniref:hypothetical protein n=1 Tax=Nocardioides marinisabuli TaxID=419476 RepID=UPI00321907DA
MSDQHPPQQSPAQGGYQPGPPAKKKHTVRNVLLILALLFVLVVGGCVALVGGAINEADKALNEEAENDKPTAVAEGEAFEHDGYVADKGWNVAEEQFGGATVEGLRLTLEDDQEVNGRTALLTFRLYNGNEVVSEIQCSTNEMQEGESSRADCTSLDTKDLGKWDTIKVSDAF